jgi:serine-type D-Ala-D-Ala carboxypeptidase
LENLSRELKQGFFSGMQYSAVENGEFIIKGQGGTLSFDCLKEVGEDSLFDLASLTKALFTTPALYHLIDRGEISAEDSIMKFIPKVNRDISILSLLSHSSGYPAYREFFKSVPKESGQEVREQILMEINSISEIFPPVYSDINFILLGFILERISGRQLSWVWEDMIAHLNFQGSLKFTPKESDLFNCAATMFSLVRNRLCRGEVEDENCFLLDGMAGHAGLFGSAVDTCLYIDALLNSPWFIRQVVSLKGAGFDRPEGGQSSYGDSDSRTLLGHLGFTGTAFLMDYKRGRSAALLTNRTHPDPDKNNWKDRIRTIRREFFNTLF